MNRSPYSAKWTSQSRYCNVCSKRLFAFYCLHFNVISTFIKVFVCATLILVAHIVLHHILKFWKSIGLSIDFCRSWFPEIDTDKKREKGSPCCFKCFQMCSFNCSHILIIALHNYFRISVLYVTSSLWILYCSSFQLYKQKKWSEQQQHIMQNSPM